MSLIKAESKEDVQDKFEEIDSYIKEEDSNYFKRKILAWTINISLHLIILIIFSAVIYAAKEKEFEPKVTYTAYVLIDKKISEKTPPVDPNTKPIDVKIESEEFVTEPIIKDIPQDDIVEIKTENAGREDAKDISEYGGPSNFIPAIGGGGPAGGLYGNRGNTRGNILKAYGPIGKKVVDDINGGLRWLKRHQSDNGSWEAKNYYLNCQDNPKMEPGKDAIGDTTAALTGYAVLCYLGMGYDHKNSSQYRSTIKKGIDYLLSIQDNDGVIGKRNYEHAIASMAILEAYGMTTDNQLKDPCEKAIKVIKNRQLIIDSELMGWDYINANPKRVDLSVSGWVVMSLKAAIAAGFDVHDQLIGFDKFMTKTWKNANKNISSPYENSKFPYVVDPSSNKLEKDHLSFVGGLISVFLGHKSGDLMQETLVNDVKSNWLDNKKYKENLYALYYSSLLSFQNKRTWELWKKEYVPYLNSIVISNDGCSNGTWNFEPQKFHGSDTSHVLLHCYALLSLEVAVRYSIVNK